MSRTFTSDGTRPVLDVVNIIAGVALVLSPWFLGSKPNQAVEGL